MSKMSTVLREKRKASGLSVAEVLAKLKEVDIHISDKTLYNWETGTRSPNADEFFQLCVIYGVKNLSDFKEENEKAPAPEGAGDEEEKVQMVIRGLSRLLVEAGWVAPGEDLSDAQLRTLASYVIGLSFYFKGNL